MRAALLALAVAAGCGDNVRLPDDGVRSGTRLRARFRQPVEGGARELIGWHDRELALDCSFVLAGGDTFRCVGEAAWTRTYRDAACTEPLALVGADAAVPRYLLVEDLATCREPLARVWEAGAEAPPPATCYQLGPDGCRAGGCGGGRAFAGAREVPVASFVGATLARDDRASRLDVVYLEADDGARAPARTHDGALGTDCTLWDVDGALVCLPHTIGGGYWADAGCTAPLGGVDRRCAGAGERFVGRYVGGFCIDDLVLHERGDEVAPDDLHTDIGGACRALEPDPDFAFFAAGDVVDPETLARARVVAGDEPGALRGAYAVADDGYRRRSAGFVDPARDLRCQALLAEDDVVRCLPVASAAIVTMFDDAACTVERQVALQDADRCTPVGPRRYALEDVFDGAVSRFRVRPIAAQLAGRYERDATGACGPAGGAYYALDAAAPPADFVELVEVVE